MRITKFLVAFLVAALLVPIAAAAGNDVASLTNPLVGAKGKTDGFYPRPGTDRGGDADS